MAHPRINVKDNDAWGKLVKTWATGKNYVDHVATEKDPIPTHVESPPKYPKPTTYKDFVAQSTQAKVGLYFEDDHKTPVLGTEGLGFVMLQGDPDTSILRLPAKEKIEASEKELFQGYTYPLPDFYTRIFGRDVDPNQVATLLQKFQLHAERIGEYTINTCR